MDKIEELMHELDIRGERWANAQAHFKALDEATKNVLSECKRTQNEGSDAARETAARCDQRFLDHKAAVDAARREANIASVDYDNYKTYIDLLRTRAANRRAEANLR